jgi:DNA-binding transcriptional ArsR family regulator
MAAQMRDIVDVSKMLGDETRASIVVALGKGKKSVGELCDELKLPQPTTSHHLALLRMSGLVTRERKGKQIFYSLDRSKLSPLREFLGKLK